MDKTLSSSIVLVDTIKLLYQLATTSPRQGLSPLMRQAMWRIYAPAPKYVHRPSFEEDALKMVPITFIWPSTKWIEKCEILPYPSRRRLTNNSMGTQYISSCLLADFAGLRTISLTHLMSIRLPTTQEKGMSWKLTSSVRGNCTTSTMHSYWRRKDSEYVLSECCNISSISATIWGDPLQRSRRYALL